MVKSRTETALYFNELGAHESGALVAGGHLFAYDEEDEQITRLARYKDGEWGHVGDAEGIACGIGIEMEPKPYWLVLIRDGAVHSFTAAGHTEEQIDLEGNGYLFDLKKIGKHWYACGTQCQVYRREAKGWRHFDEGVFAPLKGAVDRMFFAIGGIAENDLYCVGEGGRIAHYDGKQWTTLQSPTNYDLWDVLCEAEGRVFVCGNEGILFRREGTRWKRIGDTDYKEVFTSMAQFEGKIYVCADKDLWTIDGDTLVPVEHKLKGDVAFYKLCAAGPHLWASSGQEELYHFDGKRWEMLLCPDNVP
jgi:hypothetical protein